MPTVTVTRPPQFLSPRRIAVRVLQLAVLVAVAFALAGSLPVLHGAREQVAHAMTGWIAVTALLELLSVLSFVAVFRGVFGRELGLRFSAKVAVTEQAANVLVPTGGAGGLAVGAWALRAAGMTGERIASGSVTFFVITSATNFAGVAIVGGLLAAGVVPGDVAAGLAIVPAVLAVVTIAAVLQLPRLRGRAAGRAPGGRRGRLLARSAAALGDGVSDAIGLVSGRNVAALAGAWGYMLFDIAALAAAFHAIGTSPPVGPFLMAYLLGQLGGLIPVPGGVGGTDGGLVAALVLFGTPLGASAAAVIVYRLFQLGLPVVLGAVAAARLRSELASAVLP